MMTETVYFKQKTNICNEKLGGANGTSGLKFLVKNVIFEIADPNLPLHYATFMGLRVDLVGTAR